MVVWIVDKHRHLFILYLSRWITSIICYITPGTKVAPYLIILLAPSQMRNPDSKWWRNGAGRLEEVSFGLTILGSVVAIYADISLFYFSSREIT
jgi:hypothetical protein